MKKICFTIISLCLLLSTNLQSQDLEDLSFGEDNSLDIATWNIEWFPKNGQTTVEYVAEIIEQLDLDILAIQEVDNTLLFDELLDNLPAYTGYYESEWFAGLAYIYKTEEVVINDIYEIYTTSPYWSAFPRSPMVMDMNFMGENYFLINNHFKCCGDGILDFNDEGDEEKRRYNAANLLKEYIDTNLSENNVLVVGDLNDDIAEASQNNVFQMILDDTDNYLFVDIGIATSISSEWSYPSWPSHLDHILITNELFDELDDSENYFFTDIEIAEGSSSEWSFPNWPSHLDHILITNELFDMFDYIETIKIDNFMDGGFSEYDQNISDHRPVALKLSTNVINLGDINLDGQINVLDVVLVIEIILDSDNEYNLLGDLNEDGIINIIDVVQLVNIILN